MSLSVAIGLASFRQTIDDPRIVFVFLGLCVLVLLGSGAFLVLGRHVFRLGWFRVLPSSFLWARIVCRPDSSFTFIFLGRLQRRRYACPFNRFALFPRKPFRFLVSIQTFGNGWCPSSSCVYLVFPHWNPQQIPLYASLVASVTLSKLAICPLRHVRVVRKRATRL